MQITIKSRKLDQEITFSRPGGDYIYADLNGEPGRLGKQICAGGRLLGSTIGYSGDDEDEFATICRRWYKAYVSREDGED